MTLNTKTGSVTSPKGFLATAVSGNLKYQDRLDTALVVSETTCTTAAVFTKNQVVAAPVIVDKEVVAQNPNGVRAIVANSGIANACTGELGLTNARNTQIEAANALGCSPSQILVLSTGVIGMHLPMDRLATAVQTAAQSLSPNSGIKSARAIMTTDTRPKHASITVEIEGQTITLGGMAKGAGMIHPNMATMLGVITTDAKISAAALDRCLKTAVSQSFNCISVDGDTSTNDTVLLLANGRSEVELSSPEHLSSFNEALTKLSIYLSHEIVKDGEGATKFVEINVNSIGKNEDAHQIANTIATSPLVKTAFAGSDPNWGRILAAAGRAGVQFDQSKIDLHIRNEGNTPLHLLSQGTPTDYLEDDAAQIFAQASFVIDLTFHQGEGSATVWTSDLSHDYVTINADYRT
ncbi:MAG: bifunctional glutamate N-acetyltransferase/amino-acid acetyltransferase ArgJ [Chloroflexota bacterium]